jgi:hypothetical protein
MDTLTPDEWDDEMAKLGPDDRAQVFHHADNNPGDPAWRAAVERLRTAEGGVGHKKSRDHRRGRRG